MLHIPVCKLNRKSTGNTMHEIEGAFCIDLEQIKINSCLARRRYKSMCERNEMKCSQHVDKSLKETDYSRELDEMVILKWILEN
jgi:hypothetical protein